MIGIFANKSFRIIPTLELVLEQNFWAH